MEFMGQRLPILAEKIEIVGHTPELTKFEKFFDKISQQSFDFILNNFEFIGFHKEGLIPKDKKSLTFTYGDKRLTQSKFIVEIQTKNYSFYHDFYCPDNSEKLAVKFYNIYGIVAVADVNGNLYCNDLYHYVDSNSDCGHLLFDNLIAKYKEIQFPIANYAETLLNARLNSIKSIVKDFKVEMKIIKTKIDKKSVIKTLKHELLAIESSLKAYYEILLNEKDRHIEFLNGEIDRLKETAFIDTMGIVSRLIQNNFKLKFEQNRMLIDCSEIKVNKLKKSNIIYDLPPDCQVFKIGTIILPYNARTLKDCRIVQGLSYHPNIDGAPCFGESFYKLEDIVEAILTLKTINLDSAYRNDAQKYAQEIYDTKLKNQSQEATTVWTL